MKERRKRRTDRVKEGNKIFYRICKCGLEKECYKSTYCLSCLHYYIDNRKRKKNNILGYELEKLESPEYYDNLLIAFVNKIESRGGMASMEEIFIDMIGLYNHFGRKSKIDLYEPKRQLEMMWEFLKELKVKKEKMNFM